MKEIDICVYNRPRVEMVAPWVSGTIDWCELLEKQPTEQVCKECPFYEPDHIKVLRERVKETLQKK